MSVMQVQISPTHSHRKKIRLFILLALLLAIAGASVVGAFLVRSVTFLGAEGVILQKHKNDCGVAAVKNVLRRFGVHNASMDTLLIATETQGVSLLDIKRALRSYSFQAVGYKTTWQGLLSLPTPMIAHWDGNHFVVVEEIKSDAVTLIDPSLGRVRYTSSAFAEHWNGVVLCVTKP